jgi:hypothetical protein
MGVFKGGAMEETKELEKGVSKKQERIVELVKDQIGEEIRQEIAERVTQGLSEVVETQLEKLSAKFGAPSSDRERAEDAPPMYQILSALQQPGFENDPEALRLMRQARGQGAPSSPAELARSGQAPAELRLLADLAGLALKRLEKPSTKGSTVILPSGGGLPAPDLSAEYEKRVRALRAGDMDGLMAVKREFRKRGMEVW